MKKSSCLLVAAAALIVVPSCMAPPAGEEGEEPVGEASQALGPCVGSCTQNGGSGACLFDPNTLDALRQLATSPLTSMPTMPDIPSNCREDVLSHLFGCALPASFTVTDPLNPNLVYQGGVGLAPDWMNAPLSSDGQRWVTACMAQRLNAYGIHVPILLEGNTPPIYTNATAELDYSFNESYAWGNLFAASSAPSLINVCWEPDLADVCWEPGLAEWFIKTRICDQVPNENCKLNIVGPCAEHCVTFTTGYTACHADGEPYDDHTVHVQLLPKKECSFD